MLCFIFIQGIIIHGTSLVTMSPGGFNHIASNYIPQSLIPMTPSFSFSKEIQITFSSSKYNIDPYSHCLRCWCHQIVNSIICFHTKSRLRAWTFHRVQMINIYFFYVLQIKIEIQWAFIQAFKLKFEHSAMHINATYSILFYILISWNTNIARAC